MAFGETKSTEPTRQGVDLIESWRDAKSRLARIKSDLSRAQLVLEDRTEKLAGWLTPDDAEPGEKFAVWYGNALIEVTAPHGSEGADGDVAVRPATVIERRRKAGDRSEVR